ncbi:MAG TPA: aldehyde ferredoxin oxidoreductase C-terminal domain-containing protein [Candidatus Deferrimicrobiaceae bacterium]|nr:aldehyde ferredoxin oxidoreductase C-terminal domain-containing protein [Candidatus Deferrimicrobiaceae bacterium]
MDIRARVDRLSARMHDRPQYPTQGSVLFVDLERGETLSRYLPVAAFRTVLSNRGGNMFLLYNLLPDGREPLDPQVPLIFGSGVLTGTVPVAARGNVSGIAPDSYAVLDSNCGDAFPAFLKLHGHDHLVLYGRAPGWTLLGISEGNVAFHDAAPYLGMDNIELTRAVEKDFHCTERKDMAMARIGRAGENLVLCSGIMGGPKAIYARGGTGAKMGSLKLKAVVILGRCGRPDLSAAFKENNRDIARKILSTSVVKYALKTVGTPFLYKPSRILGAMGALNNQETRWVEALDADNFDVYRPGMDGCLKCPVRCRPLNDMTPEGKGGWGARALTGVTGNAGYDERQAEIEHRKEKNYRGIRGDGSYDRYDKGDGPDYVTLGKMGPMIGIREPEQVLRLNNIVNDLGLDSASAGSAIAWAMELYQRGILTAEDTGGLELTWGNYDVIEKLLFLTARREGFGDVIADSNRAVERGRYPEEALRYRMTVKGLFQSDPHDARILKGFALGLAVSTRGMDHLRNRPTLEINAKINDDREFKTALYGGTVAPEPQGYEGKEHAVRACENLFAVGDAVGMCRFGTKLFNSPSTAGYEDFARQIKELTGEEFTPEQLDEIGRNITGIERLLNARLGLTEKDDTLPDRWFDEEIKAGPFAGEKIDRDRFEALKNRFYRILGLNGAGVPSLSWHRRLAGTVTGFAVEVALPDGIPGAPEGAVVVDEPVSNVAELRAALSRRLPHAVRKLEDRSLVVSVNGSMILANEKDAPVRNGDRIAVLRILSGG